MERKNNEPLIERSEQMRMNLRDRAEAVAQRLGDPALAQEIYASFVSVFIVSFSEGMHDWHDQQHPQYGGGDGAARVACG